MLYEIRLCRHDELDLLKLFIEKSWSDTHIFLKNQLILDFQHKSLNSYNFVVAFHKKKKCFHGVLGIISSNFYIHRKISQRDDVFLAIWKVDKDLAELKSLGVDMLEYVAKQFKPKSISAIGINKNVSFLYKLMGYKIKNMRQWFIPNKANNQNNLIVGSISEVKFILKPKYYAVIMHEDKEPVLKKFLSKKSTRESFLYISARYLKHPIYEYKIILIFDKRDRLVASCVGREVFANNRKAFRLTELIIDNYLGQDFKGVFDEFLYLNKYDYVDFLEFGFDEKLLKGFGFELCSKNLYVPHLFEPFVKDRVEVVIAYKSKDRFYCTKGDSDLDRPNRINNV